LRVIFDPHFRKYTSFKDEVTTVGATLNENLQDLFNQLPQLLVYLTAQNSEEADKTSFKLNDSYVFEADSLWVEVTAEDVLYVGRDIPEGAGAVGKIIAGVVLIVAGIISNVIWPGNPFQTYLYTTGASLIIGGIAEAIIGQPTLPTFDSGTSTSSTYTFSGIKNTTTPGTPVSIIYGEHRVGGHTLNAFVDVLGTDQFLYAQYGLSEGEIDSIDVNSIKVNDQNITHFEDIAAFWRAGTVNNEPKWPLIAPKETSSYYNLNTSPIYVYPEETGFEFILLNAEYINGVSIPFSHGISHHTSSFDDRITDTIINKVELYSGGTLLATKENVFPVTAFREWVVPSGSLFAYIMNPFTATVDLSFDPVNTPITVKVYLSEWLSYYNDHNHTRKTTLVVNDYTLKTTALDTLDNRNSMYGFNRVQNSYTYSMLASKPDYPNQDNPTMGAVVTTTTSVDAASVVISAPVLYNNANDTFVEFKLFYKEESAVDWIEYPAPQNYKDWNKLTAKATKAEVSVAREMVFPTTGTYSISLLRVTDNHHADLSIGDNIYLKSVDEIVFSEISYVNTALLGLRIKATDQISGSMPNITSVVKGVKVKVPAGTNGSNYNGSSRYMPGGYANWNGQLTSTKTWTDNPIWCLYDILTNERYGLGNYFKIDPSKHGLMLANFYTMAEYCDVRIKDDGTVVTDPASADWTAARPRFSLNLVIDESKSAPEILTAICTVMRASWYYSEGLVWIDIDRKKNISQIFNMSNIKEFTQAGSSYRGISNSYEIQYLNKDDDYKSDILIVESAGLANDLTIEERKKTIQLQGVTSYKQAQSLGKYVLAAGENLLTTVSFKTGTHGIMSTVGDVIGVQHDVPQWGYGGKVVSYNTGTRELELSAEAVFIEGSVLAVMITDGVAAPETYSLVQSAPGAYTTITLSEDPSPAPKSGDTYYVGEATNLIKPFKIIGLKRDTDEIVEVMCVEYNESIYDSADDISGLSSVYQVNYSRLPDVLNVSSITNFKVEERAYTDSSGAVKFGVDCYYTIPTQINWKGVIIYYGVYGSGVYTALSIDNTGHVFIPEVLTSGRYQFVACAVYKEGVQQTLNDAFYDLVNLPFADITLTASLSNTVMLGGISGLQIDGQGNNTEFLGKDVKFTWRKPQLLDALTGLSAGAESNGAGSDSSADWLKYYKIEVLNSSGSVRRTDKSFTEEYTYTYIQNHADGINRNIRFRACAVDKLGREGAWATIDVSNPSPAVVSGVTLTAFNDSVAVNFTPSSEIDVSHYLVYASQSSGFIPAENLLVNRGPETSFILPVTLFGTWNFVVCAVDAFGELGLNYSPQYSVYVSAPQVLPDELYTTLRTDFWVRDSIFNFSPAGSASTTLTWTAGSIIRNDTVYTLAQGTLDSAHNSYIIATLSSSTATISKAAFGAVPALTASQVIIAVTSSAPSNGTNNYLCYMRQANSMEMDGAIIRQATIGSLQVADASITQAKVTGLVVGDDGISMGANATISWGKVESKPTTLVPRNSCVVDGNKISKVNGAAAWDSDCYSKEGYAGGSYCTFTADRNDRDIVAGLTTEPTYNQSYASVHYAINITASGTVYGYRFGVQTPASGLSTYVAGDVFSVVYDGVVVKLLKNGTVIGTLTPAAANLKLYFDCSMHSSNCSISNVQFGPMTNSQWAGNMNGFLKSVDGGQYRTTDSSKNGAIRIRLPVFADTMIKFFVDIYEYLNGYSCTMEIAGYAYAGASAWYNVTARVVGSSNVEYPVRFGVSSSLPAVWIGNVGDAWSYPQITIRDVTLGYAGMSKDLWETGWQITFDTAAPTSVTAEVLDTLPGADWSKVSGTGRPANGATVGATLGTDFKAPDGTVLSGGYTTIGPNFVYTGELNADNINSGMIVNKNYLTSGSYSPNIIPVNSSSITLRSAEQFPASGWAYLVSSGGVETFYYTSKSGNTLQGIPVGVSGNIAYTHPAGVTCTPLNKPSLIVNSDIGQFIAICDANGSGNYTAMVNIGNSVDTWGESFASFGNLLQGYKKGVVGLSADDVAIYGSSFGSVAIYGSANASNAIGVSGSAQGAGGKGVQGNGIGYDFYAAGSNKIKGTVVASFTGAHEGLYSKDLALVTGDILVDVSLVHKRDIAQNIFVHEVATKEKQRDIIGVASSERVSLSEEIPMSLVDKTKEGIVDPKGVTSWQPIDGYLELAELYDLIHINAVGDGGINVCKDGGNIQAGDYICSSSRPGKGMKQDDDLLHNYTVAKAREDCIWADDEDDTRMIACSYHCG